VTYESISAIGAIIAFVYVGTISSILWWMLHIPSAGSIEQHVERIKREMGTFARILVPVQGDVVSDRLVALASQMARYRHADMDVIYVIEVPLQLPITAELGDQERQAQDAFARAARIADKYDVKIQPHVERARQAGPAIVRYAQQSNADLLLMGDIPRSNRRGTRFARTVEYVFENAPCEVILDRPAME
jgi:nucleotide-binding universal stress UspA family protein